MGKKKKANRELGFIIDTRKTRQTRTPEPQKQAIFLPHHKAILQILRKFQLEWLEDNPPDKDGKIRVGPPKFPKWGMLRLSEEIKEIFEPFQVPNPPKEYVDATLNFTMLTLVSGETKARERIGKLRKELEKVEVPPVTKPDYAVPAPTSIVVFDKDGDFSYKNQCELFSLIGPGAEPEEVTDAEGKSLLRYNRGKWIVDFDQELLEREIKGDASHRFPTLSQMEWKVWVSTLWLARQTPSNIGANTIWAVFSETDILKCLGEDPQKVGGKQYEDIRRAITNLIAAKPGIKHEDGDTIRLAVFPYYIYSQIEIDKRTRAVVYRLQINPNTGDATSRWVQRRLQVEGGQAEIEWITYPMGQVQDSPPKAKARIRNELLRLPDNRWSYPIGLPTIAKNWAGIPERELRKPKQLKRKMEQIFDELKDEGDLEDYKAEIKGLKMIDKRTGKVFWKYRFKRKRKIRPDSEKVTEVVERLIEWHLKPEFKIRKSRKELETMLTTTVNKYGAEENELLLEAAIEAGYPPDWYWSQIEEKKSMAQDGSSQEPEAEQVHAGDTETPQGKPQTKESENGTETQEPEKPLTPEEIKAQLDRLEGDGKLNNSARQLLEIALRQSPHQNVIDKTLEGLG